MKGNYSVLTNEQLKEFNSKYTFTLIDKGIIVGTTNYSRQVFHSFDESFPLTAICDGKKLTFKITSQAMRIWNYGRVKETYSLIDIQNNINNIIVKSKEINDADVLKSLVIK